MSGKPHDPSALPGYPLSRKLGGPKSPAEHFAEEKTLVPTGILAELSGC